MNLVATHTPLELCDQGDYKAAADLAGLRVGQWPENVSGDDSERAEAFLVAGIITSVEGGIQQTADQSTAREMFTESARLYADDPKAWIARAWIARTYYWEGELDRALVLTDEVLAERLDGLTRFRTLLTRACIYTDRELPEDAFAELEEIQPIYESLPLVFKGQFHNQRGRVLRMLKQLDRAIADYDCALYFFGEVHSVRWQAVAANNLAGVYLETKQFDRAREYASQAQRLFNELGDKTYEAEAWDQIAQASLSGDRESPDECKTFSADGNRQNSGNIESSAIHLPIRPSERSTAMTQLDNAMSLIQNDPALAGNLLDFMIWMSTGRGDPQHEAERDHIERAVHSFTEEGEQDREHHRKRRLLKLVPDSSAISDS